MSNNDKIFEMIKLNAVITENEDIIYADANKVLKLIYASEDGVKIKTQAETLTLKRDEIYIADGDDSIIKECKNQGAMYIIKYNSKNIKNLKHRVMKISGLEKFVLYNIREEYINNEQKGNMQMLILLFEQFFIYLIRSMNKSEKIKKTDSEIAEKVIDFLNENLSENIKFEDVVKYVNISGTALKKIFKHNMGVGVMKYYNILKTEKAKKMLSEGIYNVSQVSELLGYESIHYFSKQFKKLDGKSPGEYLKK